MDNVGITHREKCGQYNITLNISLEKDTLKERPMQSFTIRSISKTQPIAVINKHMNAVSPASHVTLKGFLNPPFPPLLLQNPCSILSSTLQSYESTQSCHNQGPSTVRSMCCSRVRGTGSRCWARSSLSQNNSPSLRCGAPDLRSTSSSGNCNSARSQALLTC